MVDLVCAPQRLREQLLRMLKLQHAWWVQCKWVQPNRHKHRTLHRLQYLLRYRGQGIQVQLQGMKVVILMRGWLLCRTSYGKRSLSELSKFN